MNSKIASYRAEWARFPGFSLLFDNPGGGYCETADGALLHCEPRAASQQALLAAIADWAEETLDGDAFWRLGICATPVSSYHVTAWDGLNPALEDRLIEPTLSAARHCFAEFPVASDAEALFQAQLAPIQANLASLLPIRFAAAGLRSTAGVGLVVDLMPADAESRERLAAFQVCRRAHAEHLAARWGAAYTSDLRPHLTVAYYAQSPQAADQAQARDQALPRWSRALLECTQGLSLCVESLAFYAFTDMARFYRRGGSAR